MPAESEKGEAQESITVRLIWPETVKDLPALYANQLFISAAGSEFFLIFGTVTPPLLLPYQEEELAKLETIEVMPVAKIAVSPGAMLSMAEIIQMNVAKYVERKESGEKESRDAE